MKTSNRAALAAYKDFRKEVKGSKEQTVASLADFKLAESIFNPYHKKGKHLKSIQEPIDYSELIAY